MAMTSDNPQLPVCFLCLETIPTKEKATAFDLDLIPQKFLVFTENHLDISNEEWGPVDGVKLKSAFCLECCSVISIICNLYENLCDVQAKLADKMGQLSSLLECSRKHVTRRKGRTLMETLEKQLGVNGSDGKKVEKMRDLLGDKCKIYSKKHPPQNKRKLSISSAECYDNSGAGGSDNESVEVKTENSSVNDGDDYDGDLQNDSNDSNRHSNDKDEQDQDYSASTSSSSSSDGDDNNVDEADVHQDPDFSLETPTSTKKSPVKRYSCDLCDKKFSNKYSIPTHKKFIHGITPSKREKPFSCKICPNKFGTRISLLSHISFKHRGHSILHRPFKCDICGRGSTTKIGVVLHQRKMHGIEPSSTRKLYSKKPSPQNNLQTSISTTECDDNGDNSEAHDNETESVDVKMETNSPNGSDHDDGGLQNDSNDCDSINWNSSKSVQDPDHSGSISSPSSSDDDPDFTLEKKGRPCIKSTEKGPFHCDLCGKHFSFKSSMRAHKKNIHGFIPSKPEKPFSCELCPNKFGTRVSLLSHISFKHRGHSILHRPFKCDICGRGATTKLGVVLHKKKMHGIDPLTETDPTYNPKTFPKKAKSPKSRKFDTLQHGVNPTSSVLRKDEEQESSSLSYNCTECPMAFDTQRQKVHHTYTVHKKDKLTGGFMKRLEGAMKTDTSDQTEQSCVVCREEFKSWKLLHYHLKQKHEKLAANKKSLMCYFCNCLFCHQQSVWAHLKTCIAHNFTTIQFPCDHVDHLGYSQWVFKDPSELESHFKEDHGDCEVLKCGNCGWPFLDKNMLELHRLAHLPRIKSKYHCPGCSNNFLKTDTLQHHYNSFHGVSLKLYRCLNCNTGFAAKSAIQLHSSWCHGGDNEDDKQKTLEFLCSQCPKSYATAYQLKNHVRMIHITAQCPDCGVVLPKSKIGRHKTMKHGKEKFLCNLCGKAFKKGTQLQMHMSSHGQYRWICKYCGSGSRSNSHLKRHIGRMHKDKLAEEAAAKMSTSDTN